jgi:hypothetical protein
MRWALSVAVAWASAVAVSASKPGTPGATGQWVKRFEEMKHAKAQNRAAAQEQLHQVIKRQSGDKFLTDKTQRM